MDIQILNFDSILNQELKDDILLEYQNEITANTNKKYFYIKYFPADYYYNNANLVKKLNLYLIDNNYVIDKTNTKFYIYIRINKLTLKN
jgi:hypothetical protein